MEHMILNGQTRRDLFQYFPLLQDDTITVRRIGKSDTAQLKELYDQPLNDAYAEHLAEECLRWYKERKEIAAGIFTADGTLAGILEIYDVKKDSVTIGYRIRIPMRRRGYAGRAVELLKKHLSENTDVQRIEAACDACNYASRGVLEKCGFRQTGIRGSIVEYECQLYGQSMIQ